MKSQAKSLTVELPIRTKDGLFIATYSERGLSSLSFPHRHTAQPELDLASPDITRWHRATVAALKRALSGRVPRVLPPIDIAVGTSFQQSIWRALLKIPLGETRSYGEIARTVRNPRAVRAVGSACGANPIPVLIPCHRVLAAHKHLGGFTSGLEWKRKLLWREECRDWWEGTVRKKEKPSRSDG